MTPAEYIDAEFEDMFQICVKGHTSPDHRAIFKMVFIAGMAAGISFQGDFSEMALALRPAVRDAAKEKRFIPWSDTATREPEPDHPDDAGDEVFTG